MCFGLNLSIRGLAPWGIGTLLADRKQLIRSDARVEFLGKKNERPAVGSAIYFLGLRPLPFRIKAGPPESGQPNPPPRDLLTLRASWRSPPSGSTISPH